MQLLQVGGAEIQVNLLGSSGCKAQGTVGITTHKYQLYRAYIGISYRGTLVATKENDVLVHRMRQRKRSLLILDL